METKTFNVLASLVSYLVCAVVLFSKNGGRPTSQRVNKGSENRINISTSRKLKLFCSITTDCHCFFLQTLRNSDVIQSILMQFLFHDVAVCRHGGLLIIRPKIKTKIGKTVSN